MPSPPATTRHAGMTTEMTTATTTATTTGHVLLLVAIGLAYHASYTQTGLNLMDEGWTLYAGRALHLGWTMYDQLFWVFPPGHALPAYVGWAIDPPGVLIARWIYAGFDLGMVVALYFLARKLMPPNFALLAGLLLVIAAPDSHRAQGLFAYRYLVWSALALLCFWHKIEGANRIWLLWAGVLLGVAAWFRTTPAFAAGCAIGFGVIFATRDWRVWLRDWMWFGSGILIVLVPVLAYFAAGVGLEAVWENVFVRAVVMTAEQAKPIPDFVVPDSLGLRLPVKLWFVAFQFRLHPLVYVVYLVTLAALYARALIRREAFEHVLLFAVVLWGALFFVRSLGRSDWAHLESALPPMCLLLAHTTWTGLNALPIPAGWTRRATEWAVAGLLFLSWGYLQGSDLPLRDNPDGRPRRAVRSMQPHTLVHSTRTALRMDERVRTIRKWALPGQTILDLSASPGFYALTDRSGPGYLDLIIPGTFLDVEDELEFIRRLELNRPSVIIWPSKPFDGNRLRGVLVTAPRLAVWVQKHYQRRGPDDGRWVLMVPLSQADRMNQFSRGLR